MYAVQIKVASDEVKTVETIIVAVNCGNGDVADMSWMMMMYVSYESWRTRRRQDWTDCSSLLSRLQHTDRQITVNLTVFLSLKCIRNHLAAGLRSDPLGELERSPIPSIRIRGLGVREHN